MSAADWQQFATAFSQSFAQASSGGGWGGRKRTRELQQLQLEDAQRRSQDYPVDREHQLKTWEEQDQEFKNRQEQYNREQRDYPETRDQQRKAWDQQNKTFQDQQEQYNYEKGRRGSTPSTDPSFDPTGLVPDLGHGGPSSALPPGRGAHGMPPGGTTSMLISDPTPNPGLDGPMHGGAAGDRITNDYQNQVGDAAKQYVWPVTGTYSGGGSAYGAGRWKRLHSGIDISAADGSIVRAAYGGTVVGSKFSPGDPKHHTIGYQGEVLVKGNDGYVYRYAMHGDRLVKPGDTVNAGDPLGRVAHGHLHWEVIPPGSPAYRSLASGNFVPTTTHKGGSHPTIDPAQFFGLSPGTSFVGGAAMVLHGGGGADALSATSGIPTPGNADTGYDPVSANPELQGRPEVSDAVRMLQDRNAQKGVPDVGDPNSSRLGYNPNSRMRGNPPSPVGVSDPTGYDAAPNPELRGKPEQADQIQALQDSNIQKGLDPSVAGPGAGAHPDVASGAIPTPRLRPDPASVAGADVPIPRLRPDSAPTANAGVSPSGRPAVTPAVTAPTPQSPAVDAAARRGGRGLAKLSTEDRQAVIDVSNQLGISPAYLLSVIGYETMGTYNPNIMSPTGYLGLIQFGPREQKAFGVTRGMSFADQLRGPVMAYLRQRGLKPGMGLPELYSIINAGSLDKHGEPRWGAHDAPGHDLRYHLKIIAGSFAPTARQFLGYAPGAVGLGGMRVPIPSPRPGAIAAPASAPVANSAPPPVSAAALPAAGSDAYDTWLESGHKAVLDGVKTNLGMGGGSGADTLTGSDTGTADTLAAGAGGAGAAIPAPGDPTATAATAIDAADAAVPMPGLQLPTLPAPTETDPKTAEYITGEEAAIRQKYPTMPEGKVHLMALGLISNYFLGKGNNPLAAKRVSQEFVNYYADKFMTWQAVAEAAVEAGDINGAARAAIEAFNSNLGGLTLDATREANGQLRVFATDEHGVVVQDNLMTPAQAAAEVTGMSLKTFYGIMVQRGGGKTPSQEYYNALELLHTNGFLTNEQLARVNDPDESASLIAQQNSMMRGAALKSAADKEAATAGADKYGLTASSGWMDRDLTATELGAMSPGGREVAQGIMAKRATAKTKREGDASVQKALGEFSTNGVLSPETAADLSRHDGAMAAYKAGVDQLTASRGPVHKLTEQEMTEASAAADTLVTNRVDPFPKVADPADVPSITQAITTATQHIREYNQDMSVQDGANFAYQFVVDPASFDVMAHIPGDPTHSQLKLRSKDPSRPEDDVIVRVPFQVTRALLQARDLANPKPAEPVAVKPAPAGSRPSMPEGASIMPGLGGEIMPPAPTPGAGLSTPQVPPIRPEGANPW